MATHSRELWSNRSMGQPEGGSATGAASIELERLGRHLASLSTTAVSMAIPTRPASWMIAASLRDSTLTVVGAYRVGLEVTVAPSRGPSLPMLSNSLWVRPPVSSAVVGGLLWR